MSRVRALIIASHPGPVARHHGAGHPAGGAGGAPRHRAVLAAPAMLVRPALVGWSNDAFDAAPGRGGGPDRQAGRDAAPSAPARCGSRPPSWRCWPRWRCRWPSARSPAIIRGDHRRRVGLQPRPEVDAGVRPHVPARVRPDTRVRGEHAARSSRAEWSGDRGGRRCSGSARTSPTCCPTWPRDRATGVRRPAAAGGRPLGPGRGAGGRAGAAAVGVGAAARSSSPARRWVAVAGLGAAAACWPWSAPAAPGGCRSSPRSASRPSTSRCSPPGRDALTPRRRASSEVRVLMSRMTRIVAVRSAFPVHRYPQAEFTHEGCRAQRPAARPSARCWSGCTAHAGVDDPPHHPAARRVQTVCQRIGGGQRPLYRGGDRRSASGRCAAPWKRPGWPRRDLDLLIVTSVTGVAVPSLDARLIPRLGLRPDIKRLPIFGLGCVAGAAGAGPAARLPARLAGAHRGAARGRAVLAELCRPPR